MKVEIVIPTYNNQDYTKKCFESIRQHTDSDDYRLLWLDNGSNQESRDIVMPEIVQHKNKLTTWCSENLGFVRGINTGLKLLFDVFNTRCKYVVLQNNDTEVTENWLEPMLDILENDNKIGAVSPTTNANRDRMVKFDGAFKEVPTVTFFCVVVRSRIFGEIGFLDEDFGAGLFDDHDFCYRMQKVGYRCGIALNSFVYHHHRSTFNKVYSDEEIKKIHKENMARFKSKHGIK